LIQSLFCGSLALWLRNSACNGIITIVNFVMLAWICVSWGILFPLIVPEKNVTVVTGCFMAFFSLQFSGQMAPATYKEIYEQTFKQLLAGMFGPTRYFIETMVVSEKRTLPVQSGYSVNLTDPDSSSFDFGWSSLGITKTAQNDLENALEQSNKGWYWNFFAAFLLD